jgi:hypothetical protein
MGLFVLLLAAALAVSWRAAVDNHPSLARQHIPLVPGILLLAAARQATKWRGGNLLPFAQE